MAELTQQTLADMPEGIVDASDPEQIILLRSCSGGGSRVGSGVDLFIVDSDPFEAKISEQKYRHGQGGRTT